MSQARFVHIVDDVPELAGRSDGPVLIVAMEGFLDAGNASALAVAAMHDSSGQESEEVRGPVVASFDIEEFYDYRARRPPMSFDEDHYSDYEAPRLAVRLMADSQDTAYLLLEGPEPDLRWEEFARGVAAIVARFRVRLVVSLGSIPMAAPHTRPVQITQHANARRLLVRENVWKGTLRVPASAQSLLEIRLGSAGHDATGFVAHIPHYVANSDYPAAATALLECVGETTGLSWQHGDLATQAEQRQIEIATQISDSDEVAEVVTQLEEHYDALHAGTSAADSLLAMDQPLPSGEELGEQFERFLAHLEDPEEN